MAFQLLRQATNRWNFRIMSSSFSAQPAAGRSRRVTVSNLNELYRAQTPLVVLTAYDFCMASVRGEYVPRQFAVGIIVRASFAGDE